MTDEYKILQDKIDKIGSFGFTIKGWSVTAVIAASAAGSSANRLLTSVMVSIGLALMLGFFAWFEYRQIKLSRLFGKRARKLEYTFWLIDRGEGGKKRARILVPYTATEIILAGSKKKLDRRATGQSREEDTLSARWLRRWRIAKQADIIFYVVLTFLTFLPPLTHYSAISWHWKQWKTKFHHSGTSNATPACRAIDVAK